MCFRQGSGACGPAAGPGPGSEAGTVLRAVGTGAVTGAVTATATATGAATAGGGAETPNSMRMSWLTCSEMSSPQVWQLSRTGDRAISGVTSKEYLVPQLHWIFMLLLWFRIE